MEPAYYPIHVIEAQPFRFVNAESLNAALPIAQENVEPSATSWDHFKRGISSHSFDFIQHQVPKSKENVLCSPMSMSIAMGMVFHAIDEKGKTELARMFHFQEDEVELQSCVAKLMKDLPPSVQIANLLYLNDNYKLNPAFVNIVTQNYKGKAEEGRSADGPNRWVQEVTQGHIKDIITQEDLVEFFLVLANAIHFKADWMSKFKSENTHKREFFAPGEIKETKMMNQTMHVKYYEDEDCRAITMPYEGSKVGMLLVLPKNEDDFSFMNAGRFEKISREMQSLPSQRTAICLPRCKLEQKIDVKSCFAQMGMSHVLGTPSFANMVDVTHANTKAVMDQICISKIKQKTVLEMNETGTEASSATAVVMRVKGIFREEAPQQTIVFDRPFFSALVYEGMPLICSVIRDPTV
jgi:serpin B